MSRIGKLPIEIPGGVNISIADDNTVTVKGPLGELSQKVDPEIDVKVEGNQVIVNRPSDSKKHRSLHGLYRSLINNMTVGVSKGFEIKLELVGVGYRAENQGQLLDLVLGYSHHIYLQLPPEVKVEAVTDKRSNPTVTLKSYDKQLLGHIAAKIRSFRMPEPYKGKGIKFNGEVIRRKAGKSASAK
ncbi:MAG: 50S ribosomal protein L6 [Prolixibacteraceae bacterium]|jgi:large subunit ribosomal protein L6|nr:50S ribosomal protein L6 [Prolixibacteraceae bacterium]